MDGEWQVWMHTAASDAPKSEEPFRSASGASLDAAVNQLQVRPLEPHIEDEIIKGAWKTKP
jgi:hypothetical protein